MQIKVSGIVLKEMNIGETDRIITVLTKELGIIRAFAKGSRRLSGKLFASTQIFSAGNYILYKGRDKYIVTDAERMPKMNFMFLGKDIVRLGLAQYMSELAVLFSPHEEDASDFLRLMLNSLAALKKDSLNVLLIKAVFELRLLALAGFCPDVDGCMVCGRKDSGTAYFFLPSEGGAVCEMCRKARSDGITVGTGVLSAIKYAVSAPQERIFSFRMSDEALKGLRRVSECWTLRCAERGFKTLDFFNILVPADTVNV